MRGRGLVIGVTVVLVGLAAGAAYVTRDTSPPLENAPALKKTVRGQQSATGDD